jgi:hypothetical protein
MYHLRLKGDHYQMGLKRGTIFQKGKISFPLHLDAFQLEHGKQSEQILKKYFPEVCEEIRGVSDTIGADYLSFASWMLCMGCCMYNLEQNIPVEIRGCTAFAYSKGDRVSTDEIMICRHFCGTEVKVKFIPLLTEIGLISQLPPLSTVKKV